MSFTGKATYSAGASLPELAEDVSDVVGIVSPFAEMWLGPAAEREAALAALEGAIGAAQG